jgi:hypothetical protein
VNWLTQRISLAERLVHPPLGIVEHAQRANLPRQSLRARLVVLVPHAEEHQQPGSDRGDLAAVHRDGCAADPLYERAHRRAA